jgi:hypothetical protein
MPRKKAVVAPTIDTMVNTDSLFSKIIEQRIIRTTPAITKVAACIKAETGVGPSMASGSQMCKPSCADLPKTPQKNKNEITLSTESSNPKKDSVLSITRGSMANITA